MRPHFPLAFLSLALSLPLLAQSAPAPRAGLAEPPVLGREFHKGRRLELMKKIDKGVILVRGSNDTDNYLPLIQNHEFFYLTGVRDPGCELILCPETGEEILFAPPQNRMQESWVGPRIHPGQKAQELTGITRIEVSSKLQKILEECLEAAKTKVIHIPTRPESARSGAPDQAQGAAERIRTDPFDGRGTRMDALRQALGKLFPDAKVQSLSGAIDALRTIKTKEEIAALRYTCKVAALGVTEAMRSCHPGLIERQVAAAADFVFQREGAQGVSYSAIVGAGRNACVLHYMLNNKVIEDGELVLMDFAPDCGGYVSDLTRTFPANGRFTDAQRKLYQDVLDAQEAVIAAIKPGESLGAAEGKGHQLLADRGHKNLRHGFCHGVGLAVHDPNDIYGELKPGMVFTVEPGVYYEKQNMGVRIEDVVLVTEDGCEVLTRDCPRTIAEIEKVMAEKGVLEK